MAAPLLFRPNASTPEKIYTLATVGWLLLLIAGHVYYWRVGFSLTANAIYMFLPLSLLLAFLHWWPVYQDRHPSNPILRYSRRKRISRYVVFYLLSLGFVWMTYQGIFAPWVTSSYGTPISGEFVVIDRSGGHAKRGCNYDVWLRDRSNGSIVKVCVGEQRWQTLAVGQILIGTGKQSPLGRTIEQLSPRER
jgi:hypothetical protein